jgi:HK97 family phage prohead protease
MRDIADRASLTREDRAFTVDDIEIRSEGDTLTFDGVASTVDTPYTVRDQFGEFTETITKGSFNRTIKQADDVRLLVNHSGVPMARTKSGTLRLAADPHLRGVAPLDASNPTVQEIRSAMGRGDLDQMSIGMRVRDDVWNDDYTERTIREVQLFDVSIVTFPANPTTSAAIRSLDEAMAALTADDCDPDEVRRAIAHLETLLPAVEVDELVEERFDLITPLQDLWARRIA